MRKLPGYILSTLKWGIIGIAGLLLLVAALLYAPPVQDFVVGRVVASLNDSGSMHINVKQLRLLFPLTIAADSIEFRSSNMEMSVGRADIKVEPLPLLAGRVNASYLGIKDAAISIGTPDSAFFMQADLEKAGIRNASVKLRQQIIDINLFTASEGNISLNITPDTIASPDTAATSPIPWQIRLSKTQLSNIAYNMEMLPVIASLNCNLPLATLTDADISLADSHVTIGELAISKADARYLTPPVTAIPAEPVDTITEATPAGSIPWLVEARLLRLVDSHAIYATDGAIPKSGFDPSFIEASQINIVIDSLRNCGTDITVPLRKFSARERCGIAISASGKFSMDSTEMRADNFSITTPASEISLNALVGLAKQNQAIGLNLGASLAMEDISRLVPAAIEPMIAAMPSQAPLKIDADISGTTNSLCISKLSAEIPRHIALMLKGNIADYSDFNTANGNVQISGSLTNGNAFKPALLDAKLRRSINLPPIKLSGGTKINRGVVSGNLKAITGNGKLALEAMWNNLRESYSIDLILNDFPIQSIMPHAGARDLSATLTVNGIGIDPFSPKTSAQASLNLAHLEYMHRSYTGMTLDAIVGNGDAEIKAQSTNRNARFYIEASGNLAGDSYDWNFNGNIRNLDLKSLALSDTTSEGSVTLSGNARFRQAVAATRQAPAKPMNIDATIDIADFYWHIPGNAVNGSNVNLVFSASDSATDATLKNNDLSLYFSSPACLDTLMARFSDATSLLSRSIERRSIDFDSLQHALPRFSLSLDAGQNNIINNYLAGIDNGFSLLHFNLSNDTLINGRCGIEGLRLGKTQLDTITANLRQKGSYMLYELALDNRPGTLDQFAHAEAKGYIHADRLALLMKQQNLEGETGYSLGLMASLTDSTTVKVRFVPFHPIIGYKEWEINRDNFISFNMAKKHLDANLHMFNNISSLKLFTEHSGNDSVQEDIRLQLSDIKLSDWMAINPFAPSIAGNLSADMKVRWEKPDLNGSGTVTLSGFTYGRQKVGDFGLDLNVNTNASGAINANTSLKINGEEAMTAKGTLNDTTAATPLLLDFKMIRFPLAITNTFLPKETATLNGVLNGEMEISGEMSNPRINGYLDFDSTSVNVAMLGTTFKFSETPVPVKDNVISFNDFTITGLNKNPLSINGTVDINSLSEPKLDLAFKASEMQIVGSQKSRKSQVYGKAYINVDAKARGSMSFLDIDASVELLPGTNVTYTMPDAANEISSRSSQDLVKFVNFNDTAAVAGTDSVASPSTMLMDIDARLTVSTGTTVSVELSADGKSKVQLQSSGTLNYTMDYMDDQRFTGRLNINGGFVRYNIPVMGEKNFDFLEGSYIVFNGDMMSPQLNIIANDDIRANVSQSGAGSRVVNFDVGLNVTGSLNQMDVVFDLSCSDDITIANELKSMTPEQRANHAMNLLITGMYSSGGTQTISGGYTGTNALFNFLESQINNWASSAIKGVDISFGINQYDKTVDGSNTSTMNYSYKVSKSLFDDRFKIVVGGNYTTDADADENFAQNLIADISFEYTLNKAGTMYVRLFRHTGYESILEGEITQTGVGFVYKKKIMRLSDIFHIFRRRKENVGTGDSVQPVSGKTPVPHTPLSTPAGDNNSPLKPKSDNDENAL